MRNQTETNSIAFERSNVCVKNMNSVSIWIGVCTTTDDDDEDNGLSFVKGKFSSRVAFCVCVTNSHQCQL